MLCPWDNLPEFMRTDDVRPYWEILNRKRGQLILKRVFDFTLALVLLIILAIPMAVLALMIKINDHGPIFYRQERVTTYGKHFRIHKFRTMIVNAEKIGTAVTVGEDPRITKIGGKLRHLRLDELPQLFDVLSGNMSFVGARPEAIKYVEKYQSEYNATLLMPAGITSEASIRYKDESKLLTSAKIDSEIEYIYIEKILPEKMKLNLESIKHYNLTNDLFICIKTVIEVIKK